MKIDNKIRFESGGMMLPVQFPSFGAALLYQYLPDVLRDNLDSPWEGSH